MTKLHINLAQGLIEIEGDDGLVRDVYEDFKAQLLSGMKTVEAKRPADGDSTGDAGGTGNPKRRVGARRKASKATENGEPAVVADSPKLDKNLDTANLPAFYAQFEPKNNAEKILIFLKFMVDEIGIESPNTDQFYTCYEKVDERVPKAFAQTFRDASGRKFGFIDYKSPTDIRLTTAGSNHFKFDLKKTAE